jgi:hypothetical protein
MGIYLSDEELSALSGLKSFHLHLYIVLRKRMNRDTYMVGDVTGKRISYSALREELEVYTTAGIKGAGKPTTSAIRNSLNILQKRSLIELINDKNYLIFRCIKYQEYKNVQMRTYEEKRGQSKVGIEDLQEKHLYNNNLLDNKKVGQHEDLRGLLRNDSHIQIYRYTDIQIPENTVDITSSLRSEVISVELENSTSDFSGQSEKNVETSLEAHQSTISSSELPTIMSEPDRAPEAKKTALDDESVSELELQNPKKPKKSNLKAPTGEVLAIFDYWREVMRKPRAVLDDKRHRAIAKALLNYSVDDIKQAVDGCRSTPFHMGDNERHQLYNDIELICRNSVQIERFMSNYGNNVVTLSPKRRDTNVFNAVYESLQSGQSRPCDESTGMAQVSGYLPKASAKH